MKHSLLFVLLVMVPIMAACGSRTAATPMPTATLGSTLEPTPTLALTPTSQPPLTPTATQSRWPESFVTHVTALFEKGEKTSALARQGAAYSELQQSFVGAKTEYDFLRATWPLDFPRDALPNLANAFNGWDLALQLAKMKNDGSGEPVEPDVNGYPKFVALGGDRLSYETYPTDFSVEEYRGRKYLPFEKNIEILLNIGAEEFTSAKTQILTALQ